MISVFVLTCNRPGLLQRTLKDVSSARQIVDGVLIIDDSTTSVPNAPTLFADIEVPIIYLSTLKAVSMITGKLSCAIGKVFNRKHKLDIGSLRNLGLILAIASGTTKLIMVDDDVYGLDLHRFYQFIVEYQELHDRFILGSNIDGVDSRDTLSRFETLLEKRVSYVVPIEAGPIPSLLRVTSVAERKPTSTSRLSGGFLYINGISPGILPFPQSYNESWIWCRLMTVKKQWHAYKAPHCVLHEPTSVPILGIDDLLFEQTGVFMERLLKYSPDDLIKSQQQLNVRDPRLADISREKHPIHRLREMENKYVRSGLVSKESFKKTWGLLCEAPWERVVREFMKLNWYEELAEWQAEYWGFVSQFANIKYCIDERISHNETD